MILNIRKSSVHVHFEVRFLFVQLRAYIKWNVKHHKNELGYPLRPIASVRDTATETVDLLIRIILTDLLKHIPAYVLNTQDIVKQVNSLEKQDPNANQTFISLEIERKFPFKQIKGVPMWAHFAPPFAIITMHKVESMPSKDW